MSIFPIKWRDLLEVFLIFDLQHQRQEDVALTYYTMLNVKHESMLNEKKKKWLKEGMNVFLPGKTGQM